MKTKLVLILLTLCLPATYIRSQNQGVALGAWKDYLSYQQTFSVCEGGGKIYCCAASGVFSYNLSDNSLERYNKVTGLSDIGCTVARYNNGTNTLVVGYSDGNIDLVTPNNVVNIPDLKNTLTPGNKTINNIYFSNNIAYISCGQGVLVIDLTQDIIDELCNIGPFGSALNVNAITIFNDTIYAATDTYIYRISVNDPTLQNYQDWQIESNNMPNGTYNGIVTCGNNVYASYSYRLTTSKSGADTLYIYNPGSWSRSNLINGDNIYSLESCTVNNVPYLVYCDYFSVNVVSLSGPYVLNVGNYGSSTIRGNDAIADYNNNRLTLWISDNNFGLIKTDSNNSGESIFPSGPYNNDIFALQAEGPYFYIAPGGFDAGDNPLSRGNIGISEYADGTWNRLFDYPPPGKQDSLYDLSCIAIDPKNPLHAYAGSFGNGIVEYNNSAIVNVYDTINSSLVNYYPYPGYVTIRIGGIGFDTSGNLWASNCNAETDYLSVKHTNGTWQGFDFGRITPLTGMKVSQLLVTHTGAKWMLFTGTGILAYQDNGTFAAPDASNSVFITNQVGNGGLPSVNTLCMAEDLNGAIWIGNDAQVVVFYSPDNVFNGPGGWDAQNVYVQQTGYTQYLMQNQYVTCITVDGANRKWIGTLGGGVFLMSADGTQQILNFTAENSPLFSDNILAITIDQQSGEVLFGTDKGLESYRGDATEGNSTYTNVYAFPDPVPHGYSGPIAINNLVTNSDVKIASITGEIVYHTVALGGQAVWYGTNFNGVRVQTGVYLVLCTSPDGTQSTVTKLLLEN
jgi:hypothetical protein